MTKHELGLIFVAVLAFVVIALGAGVVCNYLFPLRINQMPTMKLPECEKVVFNEG